MIQAFRADDAVYRRYWARAFAGWTRFTRGRARRGAPRLRGLGGRGHAGAAGHAERRRPAPAGRQSRRHRSARPPRRGGVPGLRRSHVAGRAAGDDDGGQRRRGARCRHRRPTATPTSTPRSIASFDAPRCARCGGRLKPDVVFFGENVPAARYAGRARRPGGRRRAARRRIVVDGVFGVPFRAAGARSRPADRDRQSRPDARRRPGGRRRSRTTSALALTASAIAAATSP